MMFAGGKRKIRARPVDPNGMSDRKLWRKVMGGSGEGVGGVEGRAGSRAQGGWTGSGGKKTALWGEYTEGIGRKMRRGGQEGPKTVQLKYLQAGRTFRTWLWQLKKGSSEMECEEKGYGGGRQERKSGRGEASWSLRKLGYELEGRRDYMRRSRLLWHSPWEGLGGEGCRRKGGKKGGAKHFGKP